VERYRIRNGQIQKGDFQWLCFGSASLSEPLGSVRLCSRFPAMMLSYWVNSLSRTLEIATRPTANGDAGSLKLILSGIGDLFFERVSVRNIPCSIGKIILRRSEDQRSFRTTPSTLPFKLIGFEDSACPASVR
jgi:hypothetical protein